MVDTDVSEYRRMTPAEISAYQQMRYEEMIIEMYGAQLLPLLWAECVLAVDGIQPCSIITGESIPDGYLAMIWSYQRRKD